MATTRIWKKEEFKVFITLVFKSLQNNTVADLTTRSFWSRTIAVR